MSSGLKRKFSPSRRKTLSLRNRFESTLYTSAPRIRELGFESDSEQFVPDTGLALISWRTFKATPMQNFSYDRQALQKYAKYLDAYIEVGLQKNAGIIVSQETKYKSKFSIINGIGRSEDDNKAVKIQVYQKDKSDVVLVAVMLSVERDKEPWEIETQDSGFTVLPLLLIRGNLKILNSFNEFLQHYFCSIVQPMVFSHVQMMWMVSMWAGSKHENKARPLFLEYDTGTKELNTIEYSIDAASSYKIWSGIHDPQSNIMTEDEVNTFIESLENHFMKIFCIDLSNFHLQSIGTGAAAVRRNGFVKILNNDAVWFVLRHLTKLAQERTLT